MKKLVLAAIAAGVALTAIAPADAADGCGRGGHRGPRGMCRPNGPVFVDRGPPRVGGFYHGRGYWDGRRYWQNRYRYHNGWRYR
ncbi:MULTISPECIES: hypothetical protein [unclassified Sphingomonas]|uniref:GCG_CRPN prefix-to-repeats domain-containing protein n=1 Tax=unclassified Sphingomonas TaxID=196159 RepID=UPI001F5A8AB0|nr:MULTISPECIES: hypothetical protein [unclassified Sphingomonas]